jgi:hypothetical protein
MDMEELYRSNLQDPKRASRLRRAGWTDSNIQYRFNRQGFRSNDEFNLTDPAPGNMFLGCSYTVGIGLNVEDTWAYKINQQLGGTFYNLSLGGAGLDTQYRLMKAWAPMVRPQRIYTLGAFGNRREFYTDGEFPRIMGLWTKGPELEFIERYFSSEKEIAAYESRTWDAMRSVARDVGAALYAPTAEIIQRAHAAAKHSDARDLAHPGVAFHDYLASATFDKID